MAKTSTEKLLQDPKVVEEINRYKWVESERAGYDIGFERAAEGWVKNFSTKWLADTKKARTSKTTTAAKTTTRKKPIRRSAKRI